MTPEKPEAVSAPNLLRLPEAVSTPRLLRLPEVLRRVGMSKARLYELLTDDDPALRFPAPVKVGRISVWPDVTVNDWINRQIARSISTAA